MRADFQRQRGKDSELPTLHDILLLEAVADARCYALRNDVPIAEVQEV